MSGYQAARVDVRVPLARRVDPVSTFGLPLTGNFDVNRTELSGNAAL